MVMNPDPSASEVMIKYNLEPEIFSFESFNTFTEAAARHGLVDYPVHIKIDTGMHRLGFMPEDVDDPGSNDKVKRMHKDQFLYSHILLPVKILNWIISAGNR